ncbi:phage tail assembly chaperone [Ralstonia syzygii subsp. celebesensis]|uniref:phage tail assembly chaperone n=1 Tax=Ralstonia syzygii TaxID=28097 RepID=UPI00387E1118
MLFYAKSTGGFYDSGIHGDRTMAMVDPSWTRPTVKVPDPTWSAPADEPQAEAPLIEVPDLAALAPTVTVANPDCQIPVDAVEITRDEHRALLAAQSQGKVITTGPDGKPIAVDPPPPTVEGRAASLRAQRDQLLDDTQWMVVRHRDQVEADLATSLSADQFKRLLAYRQALRDLPAQVGFPDVAMPELPADLNAIMEHAR